MLHVQRTMSLVVLLIFVVVAIPKILFFGFRHKICTGLYVYWACKTFVTEPWFCFSRCKIPMMYDNVVGTAMATAIIAIHPS